MDIEKLIITQVIVTVVFVLPGCLLYNKNVVAYNIKMGCMAIKSRSSKKRMTRVISTDCISEETKVRMLGMMYKDKCINAPKISLKKNKLYRKRMMSMKMKNA